MKKKETMKTKSDEVMEIAHRVMGALDPRRRVESLAALEIASTLFSVAANALANAAVESDRLRRSECPVRSGSGHDPRSPSLHGSHPRIPGRRAPAVEVPRKAQV